MNGNMELLTGKEEFNHNGKSAGFKMLDFWQFAFSSIYDIQGEIAEFVVAKALGIDVPHNKELWTLYDIDYRSVRIEVKETSYYHPWNEDGKVSQSRKFGITMANSDYEDKNNPNRYERQNDIYVFCVVNGDTRATSNPLVLDNWDFYIVPTEVINEKCKSNKSISLKRIHQLGYSPLKYNEIKNVVDIETEKILKKKAMQEAENEEKSNV